ncbi:3-deoxy-manno-octulosonate cytidylyltransferase [Marinobacter sp. HL-58]|uniref:3-deoxy-manno-octulosonate cytidylyltransferase n=1 Tax=Marinobacter sp. HL-58 TaxID=1479237 RepID=UPI000489E228|nr:3-deoxy-manno-octulosonate cytidylyltransferase [Marinobacter sp. HL-58]KPP98910.1 MAG: 3-deoxy-manno-octulosonate cytidylyltransferase (CMP-KDO synthetase) [Marinobacter sp. HL-58]
MSYTVVIPARYASTRLPGKPLADIAGRPMIAHVHDRACESGASRVIIATDDSRIETACRAFGAEVVMTSANHASGTDRLEEVARLMNFGPDERVVNVQGDEPLIPPELIDQVAANLEAHPDAAIATLCEPIPDATSVFNPNVVKVVFDHRGMAHYFSRAPIPWARDAWHTPEGDRSLPEGVGYYRHIGIYGYRVSLLRDFVTWAPAPAEVTESLEQLRALYNGARIHVEEACRIPPSGVDTQQDLERLRTIMAAKKKEAPKP